MKLKDLFVSYEQVRNPHYYEQDESPFVTLPDSTVLQPSGYDRMVEYFTKHLNPEYYDQQPIFQDFRLDEAVKNSIKSTYVRTKQITNNSNYNTFKQQLDLYASTHNIDEETKKILTHIAGLESSYNQKAKNKNSTALGYFQFLDSTRKQYNNQTREQFANDWEAQFDAAVKHLEYLTKRLEKRKQKAIDSGLSPTQIMYGMWWRPKSMEKYLDVGEDDYVNESDSMDLKTILKRAE